MGFWNYFVTNSPFGEGEDVTTVSCGPIRPEFRSELSAGGILAYGTSPSFGVRVMEKKSKNVYVVD